MRYDEVWFDEMVEAGIITQGRKDELVHFANEADLLVQDAGGRTIHATITPEVLKALTAKGQRVILAHTSEKFIMDILDIFAGQVETAASGHISRMSAVVSSRWRD